MRAGERKRKGSALCTGLSSVPKRSLPVLAERNNETPRCAPLASCFV